MAVAEVTGMLVTRRGMKVRGTPHAVAVDGGCDPQDIAEELAREANYVFGHYNLEIYLEAKPSGSA